MNRRKRNDTPVLLNLNPDIFKRVDTAADEQNVTRTQFLRQSIERNLSHYEKHERPVYHRMFVQGLA
jgi:predicted transcriptional regulator